MYIGFKHFHWAMGRILIPLLLIYVLYRAFSGWFGKKEFTKADDKASLYLFIASHIQLLLGLVLYFALSPITTNAMKDMGEAMKNADIRYFAVEHFAGMLLAIVLISLGRILSKKAKTDQGKFMRLAIYTGLAALVILGTFAPIGLVDFNPM